MTSIEKNKNHGRKRKIKIRDSIIRNDIYRLCSLHFNVEKNEVANMFIKMNSLEVLYQEMTITHSDRC